MQKKVSAIDVDRLRECLDRHGESHERVAVKAGMTQGGLSSILAGRSRRPRLLRELAAVLNTSQEYLLGETDDPAPAPSLAEFFEVWDTLGPQDKERLVAYGRGLGAAARPHKE